MDRLTAAVLGFGLAFALTGCGGAASSSDTMPIAQPPAQPAPEPTPAPPPPAPLPDPIAAPVAWKPVWGDVATAKLRPGSLLGAINCTVGFLFVDPIAQQYYLGTAGHCTNSADGSSTDATGTRVVLEAPDSGLPFGEIGTVVLDSDSYNPVLENGDVNESVDFSLVLLDPGINLMAHPQMRTFEGPSGWALCPTLSAGDVVGVYGNGQVFNVTGALKSRQGALLRCNPDAGTIVIGIPVDGGDSGGPVLHAGSGKAMGHVTNGLGATMIASPMEYVFSDLAKQGFGNVALATMDGGYVPGTQP